MYLCQRELQNLAVVRLDLQQLARVGVAQDAVHVLRHAPDDVATLRVRRPLHNPIFLPIIGEEGVDDIAVPKFPVAETYAQALEAITALSGGGHPYKTLAIDSTSALERVIFKHCCEVNAWNNIEALGYGKGYEEAARVWDELTRALDYLRKERGIGCILIGHVRVRSFNDPLSAPYDHYEWDINQRAASLLTKWADGILFARMKSYTTEEGKRGNTKTHAVGSGERCLYTQERPSHPGGGRGAYGHTPYELPLDYAAWAKAVADAH